MAVLVKRVPGGHAFGVTGFQGQLGLEQRSQLIAQAQNFLFAFALVGKAFGCEVAGVGIAQLGFFVGHIGVGQQVLLHAAARDGQQGVGRNDFGF